MKRIPTERKEAILAKLAGPDRKPIAQLAAEEGVSAATLYHWRTEARLRGHLLPAHDDSPDGWSSQDKFNAVLATATLSEDQIGQYCRQHGLYPEQLARWREACARANDYEASQSAHLERLQREDRARIRQMEKDLRRKEKALAETAALLVLRKKAGAIWGEEDA